MKLMNAIFKHINKKEIETIDVPKLDNKYAY